MFPVIYHYYVDISVHKTPFIKTEPSRCGGWVGSEDGVQAYEAVVR